MMIVNKNVKFAHPQFFLPATGINPLQGFIRPALRYPGSRLVITLNPTLPLKLMQPYWQGLGR